MEKRRKRRLTIKQRKLIKYHLEGYTTKEAAMGAEDFFATGGSFFFGAPTQF